MKIPRRRWSVHFASPDGDTVDLGRFWSGKGAHTLVAKLVRSLYVTGASLVVRRDGLTISKITRTASFVVPLKEARDGDS